MQQGTAVSHSLPFGSSYCQAGTGNEGWISDFLFRALSWRPLPITPSPFHTDPDHLLWHRHGLRANPGTASPYSQVDSGLISLSGYKAAVEHVERVLPDLWDEREFADDYCCILHCEILLQFFFKTA